MKMAKAYTLAGQRFQSFSIKDIALNWSNKR